jgi:hypothetical protein
VENKNKKYVWVIFTVISIAAIMFSGCNSQVEQTGTSNMNEKPNKNGDESTYVWGVDSASIVDEQLYTCIRDNFGEPAFFGRYLETKDGVSYGISDTELQYLHDLGIKVVPIYNHLTDATTYNKGVQDAETAISYAEDAGIPKGVYIFADIEPSYPVDNAFIQGWTETILDSPYKPGLYGVFVEESPSKVMDAYFEFVRVNPDIADELAIWSSDIVEITSKANAPAFNPQFEQYGTVNIWQYGIDAETCNIDTNLMRSEMMDNLW